MAAPVSDAPIKTVSPTRPPVLLTPSPPNAAVSKSDVSSVIVVALNPKAKSSPPVIAACCESVTALAVPTSTFAVVPATRAPPATSTSFPIPVVSPKTTLFVVTGAGSGLNINEIVSFSATVRVPPETAT